MTAIRSASSVILVRKQTSTTGDLLQLYTIVRPDTMRFLPGFTVFPGGAAEESDESTEWDDIVLFETSRHPLLTETMENELDASVDTTRKRQQAAAITAIREVFEETGALIGQQAGPARPYLDPPHLVPYRKALHDQEMTFLDMIKALRIKLDLRQICYAGRRLTPPMSPIRFDTTFYVAAFPSHVPMLPSEAEVAADAWLTPSLASELWERKEILCAKPTRECIRALAEPSEQNRLLQSLRGT